MSVNETIQKEKDLKITAPAQTTKKEKFGWLEIEHGLTSEGDYAWHITTHHKGKPLPDDLEFTYRVLATYLDKVIPDKILVDVYPPPAAWEKKLISVIARGIGKKWNFEEESMVKNLPTIGDLISEEIDKLNPKRVLR